jgi:hypothetical protein
MQSVRKWKKKLKTKTKLSAGSRRKIGGNSDFTVAALELYIRMLSGEG